jgi:hypothetical protein
MKMRISGMGRLKFTGRPSFTAFQVWVTLKAGPDLEARLDPTAARLWVQVARASAAAAAAPGPGPPRRRRLRPGTRVRRHCAALSRSLAPGSGPLLEFTAAVGPACTVISR